MTRERAHRAPGLRGPAALVLACVFLAGMTLPEPAWALPDIFGDMETWITDYVGNQLIKPLYATMYDAVAFVARWVSVDYISWDFEQLIDGYGSSAYSLAESIRSGVVAPVASAILALAIMVQMVRIAGQADASGILPGIKDIAILFATVAVFSWLIGSSGLLCEAIFDVGKSVAGYIQGDGAVSEYASNNDELQGMELMNLLFAALIMVVSWLGVFVAAIVARLVAWARAVQIYVYLMISPIPMALLAADETRQMGIGFLRNFAATCLAGAIMVFAIGLFPAMYNSVMSELNSAGSTLVTMVESAVKLLALCALLVWSLTKSGTWAREALGG